MMNWNEVIKKENKTSKIYDHFSLNPKSCKQPLKPVHVYPEKPNKVKKDDEEQEEKNKTKDPKLQEMEGSDCNCRTAQNKDSGVPAHTKNEVQESCNSKSRNWLGELARF